MAANIGKRLLGYRLLITISALMVVTIAFSFTSAQSDTDWLR